MNGEKGTPVVEFVDVKFIRGERLLFDRLNFGLGDSMRGSVTAIVGASGVGKSTLLRLVAGLLEPTEGSIRISASADAISFLSQEPVIFEHLSAYDNALYLLHARGKKACSYFDNLSSDLGLDRILRDTTKPVTSLSGGERQRLAILRALSTKPQILLLDEPCVGLDPALRSSVVEGLIRAIRNSAVTVLYVTHHIDEIALASDRVLFIDMVAGEAGDKKNVESGAKCISTSTEDFLEKPPSLAAAKFALFPRCNVVQGSLRSNGFHADRDGNAQCESIVFLPTQVRWGAQPPATELSLSIRGAYVWTEIHGALIAVSYVRDESIPTQSALQILPGAILYDGASRISHILSEPANLIIYTTYE